MTTEEGSILTGPYFMLRSHRPVVLLVVLWSLSCLAVQEPLCADAYPLCTDESTLRMQAACEVKASEERHLGIHAALQASASLRCQFIAAASVVQGLESTLL